MFRKLSACGVLDESVMGSANAIRSLVSARSLQPKCARALHESLLVPTLLYGCKTVIWRKKEKSRIRAVRMGNIKSLLVVRRIDEVPNARIRGVWSEENG